MTTTQPAPDTDEIIGRCYTKARRTPLVTGAVKGPRGQKFRLPFGPYTTTQLAGFVAGAAFLVVTRPVWGSGGFSDAVFVLGIPVGLVFGLRHLHIDGRNPAAAAFSMVRLLLAPRYGRLRGRPVRRPSARPASGAAHCHLTVTDAPSSGQPPAGAEPALAPAPSPTAAPAPAPAAPVPVPSTDGAHASGPAGRGGVRVVSGAQALLAQRRL